jgi:hydroxyacylglutathione hydrolase
MAAIIPIRAFNDNYVWLLRDGHNAAVVDPGDAVPVLTCLEREGLTLTAIMATHHHRDHVGGIKALVERFEVPVLGPARESIPARTRALVEGDSVAIAGLGASFEVIDIPGHTAGHIAFTGNVEGTPVLFCGDTLFAAGCGRLFEGTPAEMWSSLSKLAALTPQRGLLRLRVHARRTCASPPRSNPAIARSPNASSASKGSATTIFQHRRRLPTSSRPIHSPSSGPARSACWHAAGDVVEAFAALRWKNRFIAGAPLSASGHLVHDNGGRRHPGSRLRPREPRAATHSPGSDAAD